jgi:3-hydroxyisobutyrate dehydrogenase-like beta-hydroxyacid dehydrogenase
MFAGGADVCVIGLGNMGTALAETFLRSGCKLTVWNRTASRCEALREKGATAARSVVEALESSGLAFACISNHAAMKSVLFSEGAGKALRGKLLVQLSTVSSGESIETAAWAVKSGASYLDGRAETGWRARLRIG